MATYKPDQLTVQAYQVPPGHAPKDSKWVQVQIGAVKTKADLHNARQLSAGFRIFDQIKGWVTEVSYYDEIEQ